MMKSVARTLLEFRFCSTLYITFVCFSVMHIHGSLCTTAMNMYLLAVAYLGFHKGGANIPLPPLSLSFPSLRLSSNLVHFSLKI